MNTPQNIVHLFEDAGQPVTKKQIQDRIVQLAMLDGPPLSNGMIAEVVRNDFKNARTTANSVASTLATLPEALKSKLPMNRPRTRQRARS